MIDQRLFIWELIALSTIIYFPLIRKVIAWRNATLKSKTVTSIGVMTIVSGLLQYSYYEDYLLDSEFQFLQILCVLFYFTGAYNYTILEWKSSSLKISEFNTIILKKISKALTGSEPEVGNSIEFAISTPYRIQYFVEGYIDRGKNEGVFFIISSIRNLRIVKAIQFIALYLIMKGIAEDTEEVTVPLFDFTASSIIVVLTAVSLSILLLSMEIQAGNAFAEDLPILYKKLLTQSALDVSQKGPLTETERMKEKAKGILDRRRNKVDNVFGGREKEGLDPETVERIRLMESVKRILNSTPPWSTVSLEDIAKLAKGKEGDVEIVIAGLRELKEVSGIYDIWTKKYSGTSISQWLINRLMQDKDNNITNLDSLKIFPDGGAEFSLKAKEKK
jgi:hypothetical protein